MTFLQQFGILHRFSCPYNSAQNGRVERKHRHIVESGLALLSHVFLPMKLWQYAFQTTTFLINRMPSKVLKNDSAYFTFFSKKFLITSLLECLVACVTHLFVLTTIISCSTDLFSVFFLAIASITKDFCVLIFWLDEFMLHLMLSLMKHNFHQLKLFILPQPMILQHKFSLQPL
jgi:hypothetical protein